MRVQLARFTEWAFANEKAEDVERLSAEFLGWLGAQFPGQIGLTREGREEIQKDMKRCLLVLNYGGRSASDIPPARKSQIEDTARAERWAKSS